MYNAIRALDEAAVAVEQAGELGARLAKEYRSAMVNLGWDGRALPLAEGGLTAHDFLYHLKQGGAIRRKEWLRMGGGWEELRVVYLDGAPRIEGYEGVLRPDIAMLGDWEVVP